LTPAADPGRGTVTGVQVVNDLSNDGHRHDTVIITDLWASTSLSTPWSRIWNLPL
jgi:hypothetical protein